MLAGEMRDEEIAYVVIESLAGCILKLANPWPGHEMRFRNATTKEILIESIETQISVPTGTGMVLVCDRSCKPFESYKFITIED